VSKIDQRASRSSISSRYLLYVCHQRTLYFFSPSSRRNLPQQVPVCRGQCSLSLPPLLPPLFTSTGPTRASNSHHRGTSLALRCLVNIRPGARPLLSESHPNPPQTKNKPSAEEKFSFSPRHTIHPPQHFRPPFATVLPTHHNFSPSPSVFLPASFIYPSHNTPVHLHSSTPYLPCHPTSPSFFSFSFPSPPSDYLLHSFLPPSKPPSAYLLHSLLPPSKRSPTELQ